MNRPHLLLRYLWALPVTVIGLALALPARAWGARATVVDGVLEVGGEPIRAVVARLPSVMRFSAITLGHVILGVDTHALARCRAHEQVHVRQYERWGILFFPLYFGSSALQFIRGRNPYWDNHFERQARDRSR
ncbi:MAG TPA: signal peptide prediction [Burkholderiaceae bacterium]|nr:signal peptide prediction [Burkholderiaceae bacterium]